jgi:hypothetical protein
MRPRIAAVPVALLLALPLAAATRLTYDVNGKPTAIEWQSSAFPLQYEIDQRLLAAKPGIDSMIDRAFAAWSSVPEANVHFSARGVVTTAAQNQKDGRVVVSLTDELFKNQGALAMTTYTFDDNGHFTDADIQIDPWLLQGNFNIDTALRHEVGHVLGLDHSGVLSAVMFPYVTSGDVPDAFDSDDRIAIATTYPKFDPMTGATLSGRVMGDSGGIFAAQVVAVSARGEAVATSLTNASGEFTLSGLPAGTYRIYAEPLDGPVDLSALQGTWRQAKTTSFPTVFYDGPPLHVESGRVYGNLVVTTAGAVQLNPRWIGRCNGSDVNVATSPVDVRAGDTVTLAIAGEGFVSGMTQFEVLNPGFRRISDFSWGQNYVKASFTIEPDAGTGSSIVLVRSGRETATLTGALRVSPMDATRKRAARH